MGVILGLDASDVAIQHCPQHVHVIASRIGWDGRVWAPRRSHERSRRVADRIERDHGLERAQDHAKPRAWSLSHVEHDRAQRGETPARVRLGAAIERAIAGAGGSRERFTELLGKRGVAVRWNESPTTGKVSGARFAFEGQSHKGSTLGFGWRELSARIERASPPRWTERDWERRQERTKERGGRGRERTR